MPIIEVENELSSENTTEEEVDEEEIIRKLREALSEGELMGAPVGILAWVALNKVTGFWEVGTLLGAIVNQRRVLRKKYSINPNSSYGQELLAKSREGTFYSFFRLPKFFQSSF